MSNTKLNPIAMAVAGSTPAPVTEVNHEANDRMRRIIARDAGITGTRAALQRRLEERGKPENAHERKIRLITRATERLVAMGLSRREAKRVARNSYNLARKDASQ